MYNFDVALSHIDRGVYEALAIKAAQHPSESEEFLATRVLAYCLEYAEGIAFSKGLSEPDDAARLHKASKASPRVAVYTHKDPRLFLRAYEGEKIHRADSLELYSVDRGLLEGFVDRLDRRVKFSMTVTEGTVFLDYDGDSLTGGIERLTLGNG
jgi:uncharacterized protein YaeQ